VVFFETQHEAALHYIHADAQIGKTYYLWGFNILCLLFRGDAAILIVCGEISYGKHKKLSHPFLGVGFSATEKKSLLTETNPTHLLGLITLKIIV